MHLLDDSCQDLMFPQQIHQSPLPHFTHPTSKDKALAVGGHGTGEFSNSPFVDWSFLTRASAAGLRIEVVPDALYLYTKDSEGSIWTHRQSDADRFRGHMKMLEDMAPLVAAHPTAGSPARRRDLWDILGFCRLKLGLPQIRGGGPV